MAASTIGDRIKEARQRAGMTQPELARECKWASQGRVSNYERGLREPKSGDVALLAKALSVSEGWLWTGEDGANNVTNLKPRQSPRSDEVEFFGSLDPWDDNTPLSGDEVELPLYREVELAAGAGRTQVIENHGAKLRFAKATLRRAGVMKENAACAYVNGDSMEPVLPDGSTVGVNTEEKSIKDGKLYVIDHDGLLRVKLLHRLPGGGLRIRSYNQAEFPDEDLGPGWPELVEIKGRVFWSSTMW
ncbi:XRE family transcriptional regulator [Halomonas sp. V046]|uniref:XRE family transcriptional regulator n=1 Tax=Halomonas sp. V046 TaxID=3459611 RepID=UPI0040439749